MKRIGRMITSGFFLGSVLVLWSCGGRPPSSDSLVEGAGAELMDGVGVRVLVGSGGEAGFPNWEAQNLIENWVDRIDGGIEAKNVVWIDQKLLSTGDLYFVWPEKFPEGDLQHLSVQRGRIDGRNESFQDREQILPTFDPERKFWYLALTDAVGTTYDEMDLFYHYWIRLKGVLRGGEPFEKTFWFRFQGPLSDVKLGLNRVSLLSHPKLLQNAELHAGAVGPEVAKKGWLFAQQRLVNPTSRTLTYRIKPLWNRSDLRTYLGPRIRKFINFNGPSIEITRENRKRSILPLKKLEVAYSSPEGRKAIRFGTDSLESLWVTLPPRSERVFDWRLIMEPGSQPCAPYPIKYESSMAAHIYLLEANLKFKIEAAPSFSEGAFQLLGEQGWVARESNGFPLFVTQDLARFFIIPEPDLFTDPHYQKIAASNYRGSAPCQGWYQTGPSEFQ